MSAGWLFDVIQSRRENPSEGSYTSRLLTEGIPKIAIETNFYTTVGTKIGINIGEYTDLLDDIEERRIPIFFIWITDGPTWLQTSMRRQMVDQLIPKFGNHLMNYQLFNDYLATL